MANTLHGVARSSLVSIKGFDCHHNLDIASARAFYNKGYRFCLRYLNIGKDPLQEQLAYDECSHILDSGLALMLVQKITENMWLPNANLGAVHGGLITKLAGAIGIPRGINIWCSLAGAGYTSNANILEYCNSWFSEVQNSGFVPGMYVDSKNRLSSEELQLGLKYQHYWKSESQVPDVAGCGYQMVRFPACRHVDLTEDITINANFLKNDRKGDGVFWLVKQLV